MRAMLLREDERSLQETILATPKPAAGQVLVKVNACAVCRTDLHVIDGELPDRKRPLIPGHEIVGSIVALGPGVTNFDIGARVGIPWLGQTCGACAYCASGRENLCHAARFTGYHLDGGYAEFAVADARFCFPLPRQYSHVEAAPLLCAGLIGYRSLRLAGDARTLGIYGFGAAAHIVAQLAKHERRTVYAFTRAGDRDAQSFAREVGVDWAGEAGEASPRALQAAIIFAPVGELVPVALRATEKGGTVVCGGIHMSDIPSFPYDLLWGERVVRSVANLTRADALEFLSLAPQVPIRTHVETFPLSEANEAVRHLRTGQLKGAAVLTIE